MKFKTRKRLSILVLLIALPAYIIAAVSLVAMFDRPPILLELLIYVGLGIIWILPLRKLFLGVGQPDPDERE